MEILVAGGTGFVGSEIANALLDAGHVVTILSRSRPGASASGGRAEWASGDVTNPQSLAAAVVGKQVVVDAVQFPGSPVENPKKGYTFERIDYGGTKNLVDASRAAGVDHFIDISGGAAAEEAPYHWQRFKWLEEQHIIASGQPYTIFRPSWAYGPRDVALNRFLGFARFLPFVPVVGDGKNRINPVFVRDIGAHVAAAVGRPEARNRIFELGGPEALTMDEIVRAALRVSGRRRFLLHQPKGLMKPLAALLQHMPGRPLTPDAIDFITMGVVADTTALRETFDLPLTPLEEGLASYL
ncbi:MAG TPA: NAD(P)H-binding protein [Longimicrobiaceae bacterium]|nr:NAD(P)H-binding protein [Longimicrobiaceae bacterium]